MRLLAGAKRRVLTVRVRSKQRNDKPGWGGWHRSASGLSFRRVVHTRMSQDKPDLRATKRPGRDNNRSLLTEKQNSCYTFLDLWHRKYQNHWIPPRFKWHIHHKNSLPMNVLARGNATNLALPLLMSTAILLN